MRKVFLSSTCYDLRDLRAELVAFLKQHGFSVLFNESMDFPKSKGIHSHDICLDAVAKCDVLVLIIDRRYGGEYAGSKYHSDGNSITYHEFLRALELKKEIHVFCRDKVWNERNSFKRSTNPSTFKPAHADSTKVFDFIDTVVHSKGDNWVDTFTDSVSLKQLLIARLLPVYKTIEVLFYGDLAVAPNQLITIATWRKRPSKWHLFHGRSTPTFLEDFEAMRIETAQSRCDSAFVADHLYDQTNGSCAEAPTYAVPVSGYLTKLQKLDDYHILYIALNAQQWASLDHALNNLSQVPSYLWHADAINHLYADNTFHIVRKLIGVLCNVRPVTNRLRAAITASRLLICSKKDWISVFCTEDTWETSSNLFKLTGIKDCVTSDVRHLIVDVLFEFISDGRRIPGGGQVCESALLAITEMGPYLTVGQMEHLCHIFDDWVEDDAPSTLESVLESIDGVKSRLTGVDYARYVGAAKGRLEKAREGR